MQVTNVKDEVIISLNTKFVFLKRIEILNNTFIKILISYKIKMEQPDDTSNWFLGIFYFNKRDKRIFPPKRIRGMGWTINFANPYSVLVLLACLIILILVSRIRK